MRAGVAENHVILRVAAAEECIHQPPLQIRVDLNFLALQFIKKGRQVLIQLVIALIHLAQRVPDGIHLKQMAHRLREWRDTHMPRVLRRAGIIRVFKSVQQRDIEMPDETDGTPRMRQ